MILVVGATGSLGGSIARRLLQEGKPVRLLVRPQSDAKPLINLGGEFVAGDLKDRASLDPAVHGILVQLPLPSQIDERRALRAVDPIKDVDGFHPASAGQLGSRQT